MDRTYVVSVENRRDDVIHDVQLALEGAPRTAVHDTNPWASEKHPEERVLPVGQKVRVSMTIRLRRKEELKEAAVHEALLGLTFTDINPVRWVRAPDYRLHEVDQPAGQRGRL